MEFFHRFRVQHCRTGILLLFVLALFGFASCGSGSDSRGLKLDEQTGGGQAVDKPTADDNVNKEVTAFTGATAQGDRYIVVLKPGATAFDATNLSGSLSQRPDQSYQTVFNGFAGPLTAAELAGLKANPKVAYIEPDVMLHIVAKPTPPPPPPPQPPQVYSWGYFRIHANANAGNGGSGVCVAVLDTGIDTDHPDLESAVVAQYNATVTKPRQKQFAEDDNGHGTFVSGIIAARDNAIGVVGVAPQCSLAAVKVIGSNGSGQYSWIIGGVDWVAANASQYNIKVANMSLGAFEQGNSTQALYDAIAFATSAGVTFVAAAGNYFQDAATFYPAHYDNVICVSALTGSMVDPDTFASYSNWGSVVDLIAPGTQIYSLWLNGGYLGGSGTSAAAPHVAGAAALWLDDHTGGFNEVYAELTSTGEAAPPGGWPGDPDGIPEPLVNAETL